MKLILIRCDDVTASVAVHGAVTTSSLGPLEEPLVALLGPDAYRRHVWLDLSDADSIDSSGIGWLLTCHKRMRQAGGELELLQPRPLVANVLKMMKLERVLAVRPARPSGADTGEGS
jgi:anti-anti-sigma factor